MKRNLTALWLHIVLLAAFMAACSETEADGPQTTGSGFLLSLTDASLQITSRCSSDESPSTRTIPSELPSPTKEQFHVTILPEGGTTPLYDGPYTEQYIPAVPGRYTVSASCGSNPNLGWDTPFYSGSVSATVQDRKPTSVTVPCGVANALISVRFTNPSLFNQLYSDYGVIVANGDQSVRITPEKVAQSVYLPAGSTDLHLTFSATLQEGGSEVKYSMDSDLTSRLPLTAGQHLILALKASNTGLQIAKVEVKQESVSATIPDSWLPTPKVNGFGTINYVETNNAPTGATLNYTASRPLQDMEFTFQFEDPQYSAYNKRYTLSTLTDAERQELSTLGLTALPQLDESTNGTLDFAPLIATLQTNAGTTTTNTITLRVKANNRWSDELTPATPQTVIVEKPEFSINVLPGNIWTKEFALSELSENNVRKGLFDRINNQLAYQFSLDGNTWTTISNKDLKQSGMTPGQKVYYRALYRQAVSSDVNNFTMNEEISMPYGDMELWNENTRSLYKGSNIFVSKVNVTAHSPNNNVWACVNQKTFESSPNVKSTYNLNPSTYRVEGRSGYAAALRTVGWDNHMGNTTDIIYHIAAGKLFIGSYSFTHKNGPEVYNYGMSYSSRPTHVTAWYTYSPYNNDSFKAWVVLENRDDENEIKRIGYGEVSDGAAVSSFTQLTIPIAYDAQYKSYRITHAYVVFASSANCSEDESTETNNLNGMVVKDTYHNGSVFVIDDVAFRYDK